MYSHLINKKVKEVNFVEENGSMEGKDLAQDRKSEFEIEVEKEIARLNVGEKSTSIEGLELIKYSNTQAGLTLYGIPITLIQNGKFQYSANGLKQVKTMLKDHGLDLEKIGLPELGEKLNEIELDKQNGKEQTEREEEKNNETNKDDNEKKPEKNEAKNTEEGHIEKDYSWIEIRSDREIDEMRTFVGAIKKEHPEIEGIERTFIVPSKNDSKSYKLYAQCKGGKYKEIPLEMTEGRNQTQEQVTVTQNDGTNSTKKTPIQILKINNRSMIMIYNGGRTNTEVHIGVRTDGDNYKSTPISSARAQNNLHDPNEDVRRQISSNSASQREGDTREKAYAVMINFEKQNVPDEIDPSKDGKGIEAKEMEEFPTALVTNLKEGLKEMLYDKGINLSDEAIEQVAESITEGKDFRDALEDGTRIDESAGRIPPDSAERMADNIYDSVTTGEDVENEGEIEPDHRR